MWLGLGACLCYIAYANSLSESTRAQQIVGSIMLTRASPQGCEGSIEASGYQEAHQQSKYSPVTLPVNQQDTGKYWY